MWECAEVSRLHVQVTLIREYCQGPNEMAYCLPSGCFDGAKHANMADCIRAELSEEVCKREGRWVRGQAGPRGTACFVGMLL